MTMDAVPSTTYRSFKLLNRRGRKRKTTVKRDSAGKSRGEDKIREVVKNQPHRRWLTEAHRLDQRAESHLGRLALARHVSAVEYEAGKHYAKVVAQYRAVISSRDPIRQGHPGSGRDMQAAEARRRTTEFNDAFECMGEQPVQRLVARVAVYDEPCPYGSLEALRSGLRALAVNFGMSRPVARLRAPT